MREIIFKAKLRDGNGWIEGDLLNTVEGCFMVSCNDWFKPSNNQSPTLIEIDPKTVSQYTGLLDKNGKKMFEGDIVKYYNKYSDKWYEHFLLWDELFASFSLFEKGNKWAKESDFLKIEHLEVIGNIHD